MTAPNRNDVDDALRARLPADTYDRIRRAKVGIAGLGGLGSNVAAMLARTGITDLTIADFDTVELGNINRQNYYLDHIGSLKVDATEELLMKINPHMTIEKHPVKLDPSNIPETFRKCDIVCEAFDVPSEKAMLINTVLEKCSDVKVVSGSGMAGYGRSNRIITKRLFASLYMCGDGIDMEDSKEGLMSPRVNICAGHMANTVISLIIKGHV